MNSKCVKNKRILFALGNYYPTPSANAICIQKLIEEFQRRGYDVECVVNDAAHTVNSVTTKGVKVSFAKPPLAWSLPETASRQSNKISKAVLQLAFRMLVYARIPFYMVSFPSISEPYCDRFKKQLIKRIRENRENVAAVIGVNKPIEAMKGAYLAAKEEDVPLITYFLDPLVGGYLNQVVGEKRSYQKTLSLEKKIVNLSCLSIFMDEHRQGFINRHGDSFADKTAFLGAPLLENNISEKSTDESKAVRKKRIVYAGAVYKDIRNPEHMMEAFKYVKNASLVMYVTNPEEWVLKLSNPNIDIRGRVPHETIIEEIKSSDGVLNIGNSDPIFAPSKIIEYIGFGKPIISSYRIDDDSSIRYMSQYPGALCIDEREYDAEQTAAIIDSFLENQTERISYEQLEKIYRKNTPAAFVDEVEKAINRKKNE